MKIKPGRIVKLFYRLTDEHGQRVCQTLSDAPIVFVYGEQRLLGGAERQISGRQAWDTIQVRLKPGDAFAKRRTRLRVKPQPGFSAVSLLPGAAIVAMVEGEEKVVWIREATDEEITVETGDPLAGRELLLEIGILDVLDPETVAATE